MRKLCPSADLREKVPSCAQKVHNLRFKPTEPYLDIDSGMQIILSLLTLLATLAFAYSLLSVLYPLRPFRDRRQALKGVGGSFVVALASLVVFGVIADPKNGPASGLAAETEGTARSTTGDGALSVATVSPGRVPAACGEGGLALMDEVTVSDSQELYASPAGERIINQKASAALGTTHYQQVDYTQRLRRTCAQEGWTEIEVLTPEWLKGNRGWVRAEAIRVIENDDAGKRIFVEADFYWDNDTSRFKPQIVTIVNRIARENARCGEVDTGSVAKSSSRSQPGKPVFFVTCGSGASAFNVWFSPNDAEGGSSFAAVRPVGRAAGAEACEAAAKAAANHPSTVSFSRIMDLAYQEHPSGRARVVSSFTAKNGFGLELKYRIDCLFEGSRLIETQIAEDAL